MSTRTRAGTINDEASGFEGDETVLQQKYHELLRDARPHCGSSYSRSNLLLRWASFLKKPRATPMAK